MTLRRIIYFFLIICTLSVNHIIIYNEELLVALSFFGFVAYVSIYFGANVSESLDENSKTTLEICENFTNTSIRYLEELKLSLDNYNQLITAKELPALVKAYLGYGNTKHILSLHVNQRVKSQCVSLSESRVDQDRFKHVLSNNLSLLTVKRGPFMDKKQLLSVVKILKSNK